MQQQQALYTCRSLRFIKEHVCLFPNLNKRHNGSTLYKSLFILILCVVNIKSIIIQSAPPPPSSSSSSSFPRSGDLIRFYTSYIKFVKLRLFSKIIKHTGLHIYICTNKNNNRCFIYNHDRVFHMWLCTQNLFIHR